MRCVKALDVHVLLARITPSRWSLEHDDVTGSVLPISQWQSADVRFSGKNGANIMTLTSAIVYVYHRLPTASGSVADSLKILLYSTLSVLAGSLEIEQHEAARRGIAAVSWPLRKRLSSSIFRKLETQLRTIFPSTGQDDASLLQLFESRIIRALRPVEGQLIKSCAHEPVEAPRLAPRIVGDVAASNVCVVWIPSPGQTPEQWASAFEYMSIDGVSFVVPNLPREFTGYPPKNRLSKEYESSSGISEDAQKRTAAARRRMISAISPAFPERPADIVAGVQHVRRLLTEICAERIILGGDGLGLLAGLVSVIEGSDLPVDGFVGVDAVSVPMALPVFHQFSSAKEKNPALQFHEVRLLRVSAERPEMDALATCLTTMGIKVESEECDDVKAALGRLQQLLMAGNDD